MAEHGIATAAQPMRQIIRAAILERIFSGEWPAGTRIPSENELVLQFGVSRMTVHHVLRALQAEGFIDRTRGAGSFVARSKTHKTIIEVRDIADEIRQRGGVHTVRIEQAERVQGSAAEAVLLGLPAHADVLKFRLLHQENGVPIQLEDRIVNPLSAPDMLQADLARTTLFEQLMRLYPYPQGRHVLRATRATGEQARLLDLAVGDPCLEIERTTWTGDFIVTHVRMTYPADRFELVGDISHEP